MKICIVIPVYNEEKNIGALVEKLRQRQLDTVVVNDGSSDRSAAIAKDKGATVINNEKRCGKGQSLRRGFQYVLENCFDGVVTMDGDGQHDVNDLDGMIKKAHADKNCIVTGSRMLNPKGMPLIRLIVNKLMSALISAVCRQKIPDTQCGYRYIAAPILKNISLTSSDFEIESEVLIQASRHGFKIYSVPIKTIYGGECSKINPVVDTFRFLIYIIREAVMPRPKAVSGDEK